MGGFETRKKMILEFGKTHAGKMFVFLKGWVLGSLSLANFMIHEFLVVCGWS